VGAGAYDEPNNPRLQQQPLAASSANNPIIGRVILFIWAVPMSE
jgi:hypothetical protein